MNRRFFFSTRMLMTACCITPLLTAGAFGADVDSVMKIMPANLPITIVIKDVKSFDQSLQKYIKNIDPTANAGSIIDQLDGELGIGKWIDFSQPLGLAQADLGGSDSPLLWVSVPDFAEKIKTIENASQDGNVWRIPISQDNTLFARANGAYYVVSTDKETLAKATLRKDTITLAQAVHNRNDILESHDVLLHVNFGVVREAAMQSTNQLAQMAPMLAMMMAQHSGSDPTSMMGTVTVLTDSIQSLIKQVDYIDIAIKVTESAADVTLASGFIDGPIKNYLSQQRPSGISLLSDVKAQSFFFAAGYHFPGTESPFFDYVFDKMIAASATSPNANEEKSTLQTARDFHRILRGENSVVSMTPSGLTMTGDYFGSNPKELFEAASKYTAGARSFLQSMSSGANYKSAGTKKVGNTTVAEFTMVMKEDDPQCQQAARLYGPNPTLAVGIVGDRVRHFNGNAQNMTRAFADQTYQPLSSSKFVKEALATLPEKRNAVILLDIASALPMIGPMLGMPIAGEIPPGPPIAISASFSGQPARIDFHIPARAIERIMTNLTPKDGPM